MSDRWHLICQYLHALEQPVAILTPSGRSKPTLPVLLKRLDQFQSDSDYAGPDRIGNVPAFIGQFNYCALLHAYTGDLERAMEVCVAGLRICEHFLCNGCRDEWVQHVLELYLNIGRAAALRGYPAECMRRCTSIFRFVSGLSPLTIGHVRLHRALLDESLGHASPHDDARIAMASCLIEMAKAFLVIEDFSGLHDLLTSLEPYREEFLRGCQRRLLEAYIKCLLGQGQWQRATSLLSAASALSSGPEGTGIRLLQCCAMIGEGNLDAAAETAYEASRELEKPASKVPLEQKWYLLYRFGICQALTKHFEDAYRSALAAAYWANCLGDEPGELKSSSLLVVLSNQMIASGHLSHSDARPHTDKLEQTTQSSYFRLERAIAHWCLAYFFGEIPLAGKPKLSQKHLEACCKTLGDCSNWKGQMLLTRVLLQCRHPSPEATSPWSFELQSAHERLLNLSISIRGNTENVIERGLWVTNIQQTQTAL